MASQRHIMVLVTAALLLSGCSSLKRMTGQIDDTVLPGERETVLTSEQTASPKLDTGKKAEDAAVEEPVTVDEPIVPDCDPEKDKNCEAPAEPGGVFSDG